jgi:ribonuclease HII
MTAAVVLIEKGQVPRNVRDSKTVSWEQQEELAAKIMDAAVAYKISHRSPDLIDRFGISDCWNGLTSELAIYGNAVRQLHCEGQEYEFVVDGNRYVPNAPFVTPIVKADQTHPAVSAASILAKYMQVCWMHDYELLYPQYGFRLHHGYGTALHFQKLEEFKPCPIHRKSYKPIKRLLSL